MTHSPHIQRAIDLLLAHVPTEGFYVAFSGGKDSCVIKKLCQLAGVKFDAWYNNTTIDPPELVQFIKREHADVKWNQPRWGAMMSRVANKPGLPPTRSMRWCCGDYKEQGGKGRVQVIGVRAAEEKVKKLFADEQYDHAPMVTSIAFTAETGICGKPSVLIT